VTALLHCVPLLRGLVLELLLTKVRHFAQLAAEGASSAAVAAHIQIIAMSATMSGLPQMCAWLDAVGPGCIQGQLRLGAEYSGLLRCCSASLKAVQS
jgi:hypothetical protein